MSFWPLFWTIVFFTALTLFALIAIIVAIRGFSDVKTMLKNLRDPP